VLTIKGGQGGSNMVGSKVGAVLGVGGGGPVRGAGRRGVDGGRPDGDVGDPRRGRPPKRRRRPGDGANSSGGGVGLSRVGLPRGTGRVVYVTVALYKAGDGTSHLVQKTSCSSNSPKTTCTWSSYATPNNRYPPTVPSGSYFFNQNSHVACRFRRGISTTFFGDLTQPTYMIYNGNSYWAPTNVFSLAKFTQSDCWTPTP